MFILTHFSSAFLINQILPFPKHKSVFEACFSGNVFAVGKLLHLYFCGTDVDPYVSNFDRKWINNMLSQKTEFDWLWPQAFSHVSLVQSLIRDRKSFLPENSRITPVYLLSPTNCREIAAFQMTAAYLSRLQCIC